MRRLFVATILMLIAISLTLPHACAMSNTEKDHVALSAERTINDANTVASTLYSVSIVGPNNDINVTAKSTEFSQKDMNYLDVKASINIIMVYIVIVNKYPDLGNLNIVYENDNGAIDSVYGLRSWAEQVRKDDNGVGDGSDRYNRDDLSNFADKMINTDALLAKAKKDTAASNYLEQSKALGNQGKYEESLQASEKAIELNPELAMAWNNKAAALRLLNRNNESLQASEKAIELDPKLALAWNNKGKVLKALGNITEADTAFAKAKELGYTG